MAHNDVGVATAGHTHRVRVDDPSGRTHLRTWVEILGQTAGRRHRPPWFSDAATTHRMGVGPDRRRGGGPGSDRSVDAWLHPRCAGPASDEPLTSSPDGRCRLGTATG